MKNLIKTSQAVLTASLMIATLVQGDSLSSISVGSIAQITIGESNRNFIALNSSHASGSATSSNASIGSIAQLATGSGNLNTISIGGSLGSNVSAGLLQQNASGHHSINELNIAVAGEGTDVNVSLGSIIQETHNGEINVIRIGSNLTD